MAELSGKLWEWNLARVVVVDVTDDYRLMLGPMPSEFYPVLREVWLPRYRLQEVLQSDDLVTGYLYDWHEGPAQGSGSWYVGVVSEILARDARWYWAAGTEIA
ncbi:MAG: hypothetical protein QY327_07840 [Fimbriimonadaceae bacterium]|uniref:Uncharacterized protein n=1 Tax=Candidatus Nitrosymbiomonas proteolyticus TaxID=2608984 RepID=A0A809R8R3_9BACT|nr:MAG: hypothetical protein EDM74_07985 [Armatimonadota bacterium]KXK16400.1 MAG: hypothetical protein UZ18_ATM001001275 [Armatimonadetes bacterium OLB18]MBV6491663.1 hypothetical protein [Fimbriimonadaceae bacterium]QOJ11330.1 MAG: hypothetical protein HRU74_04415 [Chthonomonadaceae bacterium]BBO23038.1 conserved hypothetical protein [Candidatus Nitrosymbiomonas proteolyticus]